VLLGASPWANVETVTNKIKTKGKMAEFIF